MAEARPIPQQTFEVVPETNVDPNLRQQEVGWPSELAAKFRLSGSAEFIRRNILLPIGHTPDPNFIPWDHMAGHERFAAELSMARSQDEFNAILGFIDRNEQDRITAENGPLGIIGDLMVGVADPVNLIPIPVVKGIGMVRGALRAGTALGAISAGEEYLRQVSDPLAQPEEAFFNIGLGTIIGAGIGGVAGHWGAGEVRRTAAIRAMEGSLSDPDNPNFSLKPRGADEGVSIKYERPPRNIDGSYSRFKMVDEVTYAPKVVDGVRYVSEDGITWTTAAEQGRAAPLSVSDDIAEQLGRPEPVVNRVLHVDEAANKAEHQRGQWHDELQGYIADDARVENVIRDANDFSNFRTYEHLWEQRLPRAIDESLPDWRKRVGSEAMRELRASKVSAQYAATGMSWLLERLNFSPVAKMIRSFTGDNYVADLALRMGGDYGWAIKANHFGWSTPPSILLKSMRHTARFHQWKAVFDQEFHKLASGNQMAKGRVFQGMNVGAAGYAKLNGVRRMGGAKVLTYGDFEEMVAEAVFRSGDFEVNGFPVNDNARRAAKAFTEMAQEYDELHRAVGNFRDQKVLQRDIKHWSKQRTYYMNSVMQWLWGETGRPANLLSAIRVKVPARLTGQLLEGDVERVFTGATHDDAIQKMIDELGDDGIALSEQLRAEDYGYTYRAAEGPPPAPVGPAPDQRPPAPGAAPEPLPAEPGAAAPSAAPAADLAAIRQRLQGEDLAEQTRLQQLVEGGLASRDDEAALRAITRRITRWQAEDMGLFGKSMAARPPGDPFAYDPAVAMFKSVGEVFDHFGSTLDDFDYAELINKIYDDAASIPIRVLDRDQIDISNDAEFALNTAVGRFQPREHQILLRGDWGERASGTNPEVVLHEALHGVTARRIAQAELDRRNGLVTPYTAVLDQLEAFHGDLQTSILRDLDQITAGMNLGDRQALAADIKSMTGDIHEVMTYALTHKPIRDWLKTVPAGKPRGWIKTKYDELIALVAKLMGWENPTPAQVSQLDRLMSLTDRFTELEQPLLPGERMPGLSMADIIDLGAERRKRADLDPMFLRPTVEEAAAARQLFPDAPANQSAEGLLTQAEMEQRYLEMYGELPPKLELPEGKSMAARGEGPQFVSVGDAMEQRVRRLSPRQLEVFEKRAGALREAEDNLARAQADLKVVTDQPHQFLNASGKPEPWYHRIWDKARSATEREQLTRAITKWYERDNPDGARARAEETIDKILNEDAQIGDGAGMSALRQRTLNIPNSWSIEDPEFGTIKISDFIDRRILSVAEHYVHRSGVKIETARMFGDSEMRQARAELREYLLKRYYEPATTDAGRAAATAKIEEAMGLLDITHKAVAGTLRTTDPWRLDNRIAAGAQNITTLGVMGKVAIASLGEILRPGMVNGFGTYFRTIFTKYLDDLEMIRPNVELLDRELANELGELAMNRIHVQQATIMDGEPSLGGTTFERWLNQKAGGLYKITGLTSLTTWQKTMAGLAAQHAVMADARAVGLALRAGTPFDRQASFRLAAMGIGERDALLLSSMPVEHFQDGKLIMPAVDAWKGLGADGRRAREILLGGIHAEMRRSIVTPSIGDRSTVFNGVWTSKGKVRWQSDLMAVPMQFLSYGMGAHNKLLTSALQGRDRSTVSGLFYMMMMGVFTLWLTTDEKKWTSLSYDQILADAYDRSGVGGFWFNGLNQQVERVSNGRLGLRAMAGIEPDYKHDPARDTTQLFALGGAAPGYFADLSRAFWDTSITGSQRAQIIRRGVPYNNVYWWSKMFETMANEGADMFGGKQ